MSYVNPGKYTHESRGYAVIKYFSTNTGHYTGKYEVVENDTYGAPWETPPVYQNRHKIICVEFCNYLNSNNLAAKDLPNCFETKHFRFESKSQGCSCYYDVTPLGWFANDGVLALIEIVARKNSLIKQLKREIFDARYDAIKYKKMLMDYHAMIESKDENAIMVDIERKIYGNAGMPSATHHEIFEKVKKEINK